MDKNRPTPPGCDWSAPLMRKWIDRKKGLTDEQRTKMWQLYEEWSTQTRHLCVATDRPEKNQPDCVLVSRLPKCNSARVWMLQKSEARFINAAMKMQNSKVEPTTIWQMGARLQNAENKHCSDISYSGHTSPDSFRKIIVNETAGGHCNHLLLGLRQLSSKSRKLRGRGKYSEEYEHKNYVKLADALMAEEARRIRKIYHQFFRAMDQNALRVMRKARISERWTYEWLTGSCEGKCMKRLPAASPQAQASRQQALAAYPALFQLFRENRRLTAAIDNRQSVIAATQSAVNNQWMPTVSHPKVSAEFVRALHGLRPCDIDAHYKWHTPERGNNKYAIEMHQDMWLLSALPSEWRPKEPQQWELISRLTHSVDDWQKLTGRTPAQLMKDLSHLTGRLLAFSKLPVLATPAGAMEQKIRLNDLKNARHEIRRHHLIKKVYGNTYSESRITPAFLALLGKQRNSYDATDLTKLDDQHKDFFIRIGLQVVLPAIVQACNHHQVDWVDLLGKHFKPEVSNGSHPSDLTRRLFHNVSVPQFHRASERWHKYVGQMEANIRRYNEPSSWPALFDPMTAPGGVQIRCLTSTEELQREGEDMHHCVAGYVHHCMFENQHIVSLKAGDGSWASTLGLVEQGGGLVRANQHTHEWNSKVNSTAKAAEEWLVNGINQKRIPCHWDEIAAAKAQRTEEMKMHRHSQILLAVGFDPECREDSENAYTRWQLSVPDILPEKSVGEMLKRTGIDLELKKILLRHKQWQARQKLTNE